jgi:hypothetical protein
LYDSADDETQKDTEDQNITTRQPIAETTVTSSGVALNDANDEINSKDCSHHDK